MIQLFIDYATNKILGYNTIIPSNTKDLILVDDRHMGKLSDIGMFDSLYYENGEIVEKEEADAAYAELKELCMEERAATEKVREEHRIFMDNILDGIPLGEAAAITRGNRERLEAIRSRKREFDTRQEARRQEALAARFEAEEAGARNRYFLSIVAVVRDENDYLEEWISYHLEQMGVEHIYLYDNESKVPVKEYLEGMGFRHMDRLTILGWPTSGHTQQDTCSHWLERHGHESKWFIVMDVDEFITRKSWGKTLPKFLGENARHAAIKCLWRHYTAGGQEKQSPEPVMERFTEATDWGEEKHGGKYFAQSNRVSHFTGYVPQARLQAPRLEHDSGIVQDSFQLNHYITKSHEEWVKKLARGSVNPNFMRRYRDFFAVNPDMAYLDTGEDYLQGYGAGAVPGEGGSHVPDEPRH